MTPKEFLDWMADLGRRFPQTGEWLKAQPPETRAAWYDDVFAGIEYRDAVAVNQLLMRGQGDIEAWQRERIPAIYIKRTAELRYDREQRTAATKSREEQPQLSGTRRSFDSGMRRVLARIERQFRAYREEHDGQRMPDDAKQSVIDEACQDITDDGANFEGRYRCLTCLDSGWVSFRDDNGKPMTGVCRCERGKKREQNWNDRRKTPIGNAPLRCERVATHQPGGEEPW